MGDAEFFGGRVIQGRFLTGLLWLKDTRKTA
jgi:hypothetical protein